MKTIALYDFIFKFKIISYAGTRKSENRAFTSHLIAKILWGGEAIKRQQTNRFVDSQLATRRYYPSAFSSSTLQEPTDKLDSYFKYVAKHAQRRQPENSFPLP